MRGSLGFAFLTGRPHEDYLAEMADPRETKNKTVTTGDEPIFLAGRTNGYIPGVAL